MTQKELNIIPEPVNISSKEGAFTLNEKTLILTDLKLKAIAEQLKQILLSTLGLNLVIKEGSQTKETNNIIILKTVKNEKQLNHEGYTLIVSQKRIEILAPTPNGIFYGIQTMRQLIPLKIIGTKNIGLKLSIPCVVIEDYPRFQCRGFMLDVARHFFEKDEIKKVLDFMALLKLNKFHFHLTDDQGWRVEIKKYPLLTEIGSKREGTIASQRSFRSNKKNKVPLDGIPVSGYYTQQDLRELIQYATERFITIIPELDFPGHTTAALAAYPELSCTGGPFKVSTRFGIHKEVLCIGKEKVFEFTQNVLNEIIEIFPSSIIHIGGDEAPKKRWKKCLDCQARIKDESLGSVENLQVYFTNRIADYLGSKGRQVIGWNEILNDKLNENAICHYWTMNLKQVLEHARLGRKVVMSEMSAVYLNYPYKIIPLERAYNYEPIPNELEAKYHDKILGIEACLWTEFVKNKKNLEWQAFPRLIAVAETGWTPKNKKNFKSFQKRLEKFNKWLDLFKVNYAKKEEYLL
ncbi:MAG: beta-N-acetylhexosaminidase [Promethearchaeota archaeon Loki_b31]|nr:MAG: beta-N-acetylhexosaminidase [Candidatus Lokiarchaeota archaeon Loki_b31]